MATRPTKSQARLFAQLIAELEPEIHRAFMASVTDLQAGVDWLALLDALTDGDIPRAIEALHIDAAAWAEYSSVMTNAYSVSAASTIAQIQAIGEAGIGTRFRMTNARAQQWIRENVGNRIVGFESEQIRIAREVIERGYAAGQGPRNIAIDLVGRVTDGSRRGGVLGLDGPRAERWHRVALGMRTPEGVKGLVVEHLDGTRSIRYQVNKATADRIFRAFHAGTEVPASEREISDRQYRNALLQSRAETVARTESSSAVMSARMEAWQQAAESQGLDASAVIKTWRHHRGAEKQYRPDHYAMSGKSVRGLETPFVFASGDTLLYASDPNGAARQVINCGCSTEFRISHAAGLR